jgi:hypothetical protein
MLMTAVEAAAAMPHACSLAGPEQADAEPEAKGEAARIGELLAVLVQDGNVRAMEALALAMVRSDWGRICAAAAAPPRGLVDVPAAAAAAGERIARRTLAGTLPNVAKGASRFHRVGDFPDWARQSRPVAEIGDFLFYEI